MSVIIMLKCFGLKCFTKRVHCDPTLISHMLTLVERHAGVLTRLACVMLSLLFRPQ